MQHSVVVKLAYGADIARLRLRLLAALAGIERVMSDEGHATEVHLSNLLADGLELTVWYWVGDPPSGLSDVRSQVNLGVLAVLEAEGQRPVAPAITTPPG